MNMQSGESMETVKPSIEYDDSTSKYGAWKERKDDEDK